MVRLQRAEFHSIKQDLRFVGYSESTNGHIRAELRHKLDKKPKYYHWLNPEEEAKFKASSYYNNELYKNIRITAKKHKDK